VCVHKDLADNPVANFHILANNNNTRIFRFRFPFSLVANNLGEKKFEKISSHFNTAFILVQYFAPILQFGQFLINVSSINAKSSWGF
jgi:hypothetical protein